MVEATDIAEKIHGGHADHGAAHAAGGGPSHDRFRQLTGVYVGVVAMLLAIAALGGAHAMKEMLNANIHASDTYAFYQAKYLRQTDYQIAADQLDVMALAGNASSPAAAARAAALIKHYRSIVSRYDSEPATGNGKKELLAKAHKWEERREIAEKRDHNFDYSVALFQIAVVLGSVSIAAASWFLLAFSGTVSVLGIILMLNGYFLLVPLPF